MKKNVLILFLLLIVKNSIIFSAITNHDYLFSIVQNYQTEKNLIPLIKQIPTILKANTKKVHFGQKPFKRVIYQHLLTTISKNDPYEISFLLEYNPFHPFEILNAIHIAFSLYEEKYLKRDKYAALAAKEILFSILRNHTILITLK